MSGYGKTAMLMAGMTALFMGLGALIGGGSGAMFALVMAGAMNLFAYWNSDKAVLRMTGAEEVDERTAPQLVRMVNRLADGAGMPRPKVYIIHTDQPNAFATGRNPQNAAVAATTGLLRAMPEHEIAAVMAHELAHVRNRDTLIMSITATMAGAIAMLANMAMFMGPSDRERQGGLISGIAMMILAPMAASIVQMAISRSREYEADRAGAEICGNPIWLADALRRIERLAQGIDNPAAEGNPAVAHMFIINPLHGGARDKLFSTHPATANRVAALEAMAGSMPRAAAPTAAAAPLPPFARSQGVPPQGGTGSGPFGGAPRSTQPGSSSIPRVGRRRP